MKFISEPARLKFASFLQRTFKPAVSVNARVAAFSLSLIAAMIAMQILNRFSYAYCHLLAGLGITWFGYVLLCSPRLALVFTVLSELYNELIFDMSKPDHPNIDWDQLAAGISGAIIGFWILHLLLRIWPGRPWNLAPKPRREARASSL